MTSRKVHLIGPYRLDKTIGVGIFAKVKLAYSIYNQTVAIKIFNKNQINKTPTAKEQFDREIEALRKLSHPNIVQFYDLLENEKYVYLVMEYCEYGELYQYISDKNGLLESEAALYFKQICEAVQFCHQNFIVHRDIKPENVLRGSSTCVKLVDFGLSRFFPPTNETQYNDLQSSYPNQSPKHPTTAKNSPQPSPTSTTKSSPKTSRQSPKTSTSQQSPISPRSSHSSKVSTDIYHLFTQCGSVHYCSPELLQADEGKSYDGIKSDIWSLGVLLYTLVCACLPFSGDSIPVLVKKIAKGHFKFPKDVPLTPQVRNLIQSILKVDPNERFSIEQILQHEWFKYQIILPNPSCLLENRSTSFQSDLSTPTPLQVRHRDSIVSRSEIVDITNPTADEHLHDIFAKQVRVSTPVNSSLMNPLTTLANLKRNTSAASTTSTNASELDSTTTENDRREPSSNNDSPGRLTRGSILNLPIYNNNNTDASSIDDDTNGEIPSDSPVFDSFSENRLTNDLEPNDIDLTGQFVDNNPKVFSATKRKYKPSRIMFPVEKKISSDAELSNNDGVIFRQPSQQMQLSCGQITSQQVCDDYFENESNTLNTDCRSSKIDIDSFAEAAAMRALNEKKFFEAVLSNNVKTVKELIEPKITEHLDGTTTLAPPLVDCRVTYSDNQDTGLHLAAKNGYFDMVETLLTAESQPLDINARNSHGDSALILAAQRGHFEVCKLLCRYSASIHLQNNELKSAIWVARENNYQIISIYLTHISTMRHKKHIDLLYHSIENNKTPSKSRILSDSTAAQQWLSAEFHRACECGDIEKIKHLLPQIDLTAKGIDNFTALHFAARKGRLDVVHLLVEKGCDINAKTKNDYTPLIMTVDRGFIDCTKYLIEKGADISVRTKDNLTALLAAQENGNHEILQLIQDAINANILS